MATQFWWEYLAEYPIESMIVIGGLIGSYFAYVEIIKFWKPMLFITTKEWRIHRYIGTVSGLDLRNFKPPGKKGGVFPKDAVEFKAILKIPGKKPAPIILNNKDIIKVIPRKLLLNKKYIYWNPEEGAYALSNTKPIGYHINPSNLEGLMVYKLDNIEAKATRAAPSAPQIIHHGLMQHSIPLDPGQYSESEEATRFRPDSHYIFNTKKIGGYKTFETLIEEEDEIDEKSKEVV